MNANIQPTEVVKREGNEKNWKMAAMSQTGYHYNGKNFWVYRATADHRESGEWKGFNVMLDGKIIAEGFDTDIEAVNFCKTA